MSLQEMQQFQEKHEVARADNIVGTDQPHTASVGMHQGNARDLPDDTQRWRLKLPGGIHQQEFVWHNETCWPAEKTEATTDEDPDTKNLLIVYKIAENYEMLSYLNERISSLRSSLI